MASAAPAPAAPEEPANLYEMDTDAQKAAPNSTMARVLGSMYVRACVRSDVPPFGSFSSQHSLEGLDIELANELVRQMSIDFKQVFKVEWAVVDAADRMDRLKNGACDILVANFSQTAERAKEVDMSKIYLRTDKVLVAANAITRKSPVVGHVGGTTGDMGGIKGTAKMFHSYQQVVYDMDAGGVDYVITDRPIAEYLVRSSTKGFKITKTLAKNAEAYTVAVAKGDGTLLAAVNRALEELARQGRLALMQRRWL